MKTLIATAAVAFTLTAAGAAFASAPNRGSELARNLHRAAHHQQAYALSGHAQSHRRVEQQRHPVQDQISRGRAAY